jgi:hypothetical protein
MPTICEPVRAAPTARAITASASSHADFAVGADLLAELAGSKHRHRGDTAVIVPGCRVDGCRYTGG